MMVAGNDFLIDFSPWKGVFDFGRNAVLLLTKGKGEFSLR